MTKTLTPPKRCLISLFRPWPSQRTSKRTGIKNGQADRKGKRKPHTLRSAFRDFFVGLTLYYYMCSETDFTHEKNHFHPTARIPDSSVLLLLCHKMVG